MLPPCAIFELRIHQNAFVARASPQTAPLGLAGFQGATSQQKRERGGKKGKGAFHHFFFAI